MRLETEIRLLRVLASDASHDIDSALFAFVREACCATSWPWGQVWRPRRGYNDEALECGPVWFGTTAEAESLHESSSRVVLKKGESLPGRAWASPIWMSDLYTNPDFGRSEGAVAAG